MHSIIVINLDSYANDSLYNISLHQTLQQCYPNYRPHKHVRQHVLIYVYMYAQNSILMRHFIF